MAGKYYQVRTETTGRSDAYGSTVACIDPNSGPVLARRWQDLKEAITHPSGPLQSPDDGVVIHHLQKLGHQAARRTPSVRQQVAEDAPSVLLLAFAAFQRGRPFVPWAMRVLANHAISLLRRHSRTRPDSDLLAGVPGPLLSPVVDELAELLHQVRRLCDGVSFPRPTVRGPELEAVFVLEARLRLLDWLPYHGPSFLDTHLPLRERERRLRVREGWPTVAALWADLARQVESPLRRRDALHAACLRLAPDVDLEGLDQLWPTWVRRARLVAERHLETPVHASLIDHLFPSRGVAATLHGGA